MNTRRYPRTLNQAFPFGPEYGAAIERPSRVPAVLSDAALAAVIGLGLAALLVAWWSA